MLRSLSTLSFALLFAGSALAVLPPPPPPGAIERDTAILIAKGCSVEDAIYQQRSAPSITARFEDADTGKDWPAKVALRMHFAGSGRTYWWLPWNGGTSGEQFLASTTDVQASTWQSPSPDDPKQRPLGDVHFIPTDASYRVLKSIPTRGGTAPAHFFVPDLREALWYRTPNDKRDGDAHQFFDLVKCSHRDAGETHRLKP